MDLTEKQLTTETKFEGKIFTVRHDSIELPDGSRGIRDVVEASDAAAILPVDGNGFTYLIRQYRYAQGRETLEAAAGKLDKGEEPSLCAVRELREETGLTAEKIISLGSISPSTAILTEKIHLYLALDLSEGESCPDEGEFLRVEKYSFNQLHDMIVNNEIEDAKTIAIYYKAADYLSGR